MNFKILEEEPSGNCIGCMMSGKPDVKATVVIERVITVRDPCPDAYQKMLVGTICLVLHQHNQAIKENLCEKHYDVLKGSQQNTSMTTPCDNNIDNEQTVFGFVLEE